MTGTNDMTAVAIEPVPGQMTSPSRLLNRDYGLLLQGQFVSRLGTSLSSLVMLLWIKEATGSASLMGLLSMLSSIPTVLFGIVGGTVADRASRRKIIAFCDIASGIALLTLGGLFFLYPGETVLLTIGVVSLSVVVAILDAFSSPAISAAIPDLVPPANLARANSFSQLAIQLASLLGQGLGGVLFRLLGALWAAVANGLACLYAGLTETIIVIPQRLPQQLAGWRDQLRAFLQDSITGFKYVLRVGGLKSLVLASCVVTFFNAPLIMLIPYYVIDFLGLTEDWVGYVAALYGIGAFIGSVSAGVKELNGKTRGAIIISTMLLESLGYAFLGLIRDPLTACSLVFVGGALGGFVGVYIVTIVQVTTPSELRGRMFGFLATIASSLAPIGMGVGGVVFDWIGQNIPLMYGGCGLIMALVLAAVSLKREFREYLAYEIHHEPTVTHPSST